MSIDVLPHQAEFLKSNFRHTGLIGGFGCGKSHAGTWKTITKKLAMPNIDVAYYLPTYPLIKDIAYGKFTEALEQINIKYQLNKTDKEIITDYGRIIFRSMDNPDLIVGYEVGYSLVDEADILPKEKMIAVMKKIMARNRAVYLGNNNATDFVSTPEGFRFLYEFFVTKSSKDKNLIKAKTKSNPFLPDDYIKSLEDEYTPSELEAYLNGEFVNLTAGTVYNEYNRDSNHTDREVKQGETIHVGVDFNIGKMAGIIVVIDNGSPRAVDEVVNAYDTKDLSQKLVDKYKGYRIIAYPDASGRNRKTSASKTDIEILKSFGIIVKALPFNPPVKDRVNTMNKMFFSRKLMVNKFNCPKLTDCLEQLPYKNGEPDKTLDLDHPTDALGYMIWYHYGRNKFKAKIT